MSCHCGCLTKTAPEKQAPDEKGGRLGIVDRALGRLERRFGGTTTQTSFDYTDSTLQELTDATGKPSVAATAAVQFALGLTSRAFMVAEVMPRTDDTARLTPETAGNDRPRDAGERATRYSRCCGGHGLAP